MAVQEHPALSVFSLRRSRRPNGQPPPLPRLPSLRTSGLEAVQPTASLPAPGRVRSPRVSDTRFAAHPDAHRRPGQPSRAEVDRLVEMAALRKTEAVALGGGRDAGSQAAIRAFEIAWTERGGPILEMVDWPAQAASWLRPARRLAACAPDLWVVCDTPAGWAQMARRLRTSTDWDPSRTLGFAALGTITTVEAAGPGILNGMGGTTVAGDDWWITADRLFLAGDREESDPT